MLEFRGPLMLEGDLQGALEVFAPGPETCPEEWLLQNPGLLLNVLAAFRDAGADLLPAVTFGANALALADYGREEQFYDYNRALVKLTADAAPLLAVAGGMGPVGHPPEPFGPLPYTDLIGTCAEQALALRNAGAAALLLEGMPNLCEARAAVLGAKQAHLPILVTLAVRDGGLAGTGGDPLAALVCLQELGIAAFGLCGPDAGELTEQLVRLAPHAKVPLMARPAMEDILAEEVSRDCWGLLAAGVKILGGGKGATPAHMQALRVLLDEFDYESFPPPAPSEDPAVLLCDDGAVYYLDLQDRPAVSAPIVCQPDMSTAIIAAEADDTEVLLFHLKTVGDAYDLGQNLHLCNKAVCFYADSAEALEMALLYHNGRALISGACPVEEAVLHQLAQGYGGVVFRGEPAELAKSVQ